MYSCIRTSDCNQACTYVHTIAFRLVDTYTEGYSDSRYVCRDDVAFHESKRRISSPVACSPSGI